MRGLVAVATIVGTVCAAGAAREDDLAQSVELPAADFPLARCLDGSRARYYLHRPDTPSRRWYVHQEGGGFCTSLEDCVKRSKTSLGSTLPSASDPWGPTLNLTAQQPVFSRDAAANPLLHDWNHVFLAYCDGAYFSGDNGTRTVTAGGAELFFRGRRVLDGALEHLAGGGMAAATDVVLGGCSAGGIATYAHLDYVAVRLARLAPGARVAGLADSGFYADVPFFTDQKAFPMRAQNASATLSSHCLAEHAAAPHKCLVAEVNARYVRTPLFAWQSKFDADQLASSLDPPCKDGSCADPYGAHLAAAITAGLFAPGSPAHGAFVGGCHRHCNGLPEGGDALAIASADGVTWLQHFARWYDGTAPANGTAPAQPRRAGEQWLAQQHAPHFPCTACCSGPA